MYLLTLGYFLFLVHTSLVMTFMLFELSVTSGDIGENTSPISARTEYSRGVCLTLPTARCDGACTHACGKTDANGVPAQLTAHVTSMQNLKPLRFCSAHSIQYASVFWVDLICKTRNKRQQQYVHSSTPGPGQDQGHTSKGGLLVHLKSHWQLMRLYLNRCTYLVWAGHAHQST